MLRRLSPWLLVGLLIGPALAPAQQRQVEPRVDELLRAMGHALADAERFEVHAEATFDEVAPNGQKIQFGNSVDLALWRPNRLQADFEGDRNSVRFFYDGETMTMFDRAGGRYDEHPAPRSLDRALEVAMQRYGTTVPLGDMLYADPYATLIEYVLAGEYVGLHRVEGVPCHHLAFQQRNIDWQVWIEEERKLPRKFLVTVKWADGAPQYTTVFSNWRFPDAFPEDRFDFEPPKGARKVDALPIVGWSPVR